MNLSNFHEFSGTVSVIDPDVSDSRVSSKIDQGWHCFFKGRPNGIPEVLAELDSPAINSSKIARILRQNNGPWAFIAWKATKLFAATDHCRSWPVFLGKGSKNNSPILFASFEANAIQQNISSPTLCAKAIKQAVQAGYVLGTRTLVNEISQLGAGEFIIRDNGLFSHEKWYNFSSHNRQTKTTDCLHQVAEQVFLDVRSTIGDRPVFVPLSGGLDSRFILAKLVEIGVRNIQAFSYGTSGNIDANEARKVAEQLDIPWRFIKLSGNQVRAPETARCREDYRRKADQLVSSPNEQDFLAIIEMKKRIKIPTDAVFINGQTGDFLSGNHLPKEALEPETTVKMVCELIADKHLGLWKSIKPTGEELENLASELIKNNRDFSDDPASLLDLFEYQERQAKWVINGQRIYEYFGYDWILPFWDRRFTDFFANLSLDQKLHQKLYVDYLKEWDFKRLFSGFSRPSSSWPRGYGFFKLGDKIAQVAGGDNGTEKWLQTSKYWGHYSWQWQQLPFRKFFANRGNHRSMASWQAVDWVRRRISEATESEISNLQNELGEDVCNVIWQNNR